ncbi:hypothetical protein KTAU_01930 [Thermogemmatispora aurantia]|uniref:Uncharacterized protein n=1 Tax=Thermogemmatispora aurantia TaxID=2045279 RepID=A0A5J4K112_9CHLR|nr:hypothetical protein KTAU_01930 [Thermogemmatispora aurantia]
MVTQPVSQTAHLLRWPIELAERRILHRQSLAEQEPKDSSPQALHLFLSLLSPSP